MITVQLASVPEREGMLEKVVASLRPQCDKIWVGLNKYQHTPSFLKEGEYKHFDNSTGDAVKFYGAENLDGWVLTCDDDLIYPEGYVDMMCLKVYQYQSPVTLHGKNYHRPPQAFDKCTEVFRCLGDVEKDAVVDVGGTGVLCYHTNLIKVRYSDFKIPNMADLWFAKLCKEQGVNIVVIAHKADYLTYLDPEETIYASFCSSKFELQTKVLKSFL
jgi:hypothetical protein